MAIRGAREGAAKVRGKCRAGRTANAIERQFQRSIPAPGRLGCGTRAASNMFFRHCCALLLFAAIAVPAVPPLSGVAAAANAAQYLLFQIFTGNA